MTTPLLILSITFALLLLLGVPVAFSIGLSALATLAYEGLPLEVGFQQMTAGMSVFSFLAIPFFIFAGELMLYGGIADRIVNFARALIGHVRGGLACPMWWLARCLAASPARRWPMSRPWVQ